MSSVAPELYDADFYEAQHKGSSQSAAAVLPLLLARFRPASVVDVGCGRGTWLSIVQTLGISDFTGMDGDYVARERLAIPPAKFIATDLSKPISVARRYDLALCLEVAEHLPPSRAASFVGDLVALADVLLFSAAVPYQGGTGHINEQWPDYWARQFAQHDFAAYDFLRPAVWNDARVEYWYRQNLLVFARPELGDRLFGSAARRNPEDLNIVHPMMYLETVGRDRRASAVDMLEAAYQQRNSLAHAEQQAAIRNTEAELMAALPGDEAGSAAMAALVRENRLLQQEVRSVYASTSWQVTAPLRILRNPLGWWRQKCRRATGQAG